MKISRLFLLLLPILAVGLLAPGCASSKPQISAWRNPSFAPSPTNRLALTLRPHQSPEDARLGDMLVAELERKGFKLVPSEQADYLLTYALDQVIDTVTFPDPLLNTWQQTPPAQTTWQMNQQNPFPRMYAQNWTGSGLKTISYFGRNIRLYLYTNPKTHEGNFQVAWQGNIDIDQHASEENELLSLKALLGYFGTDHNGPVQLPP
jgi:hypothetical protein